MDRRVFTRRLARLWCVPLIGALVTAAAGGIAQGARTNAHTPATLVLSRNGKVLKVFRVDCGSNFACTTIELDWPSGKCPTGSRTEIPPVVVVLTSQNQDTGKPAISPCVPVRKTGAARHVVTSPTNDVEYMPGPPDPTNGNQTIKAAYWTRNGVLASRILPPETTARRHMHPGTNSGPDAIHVYLNYGPREHLSAVKLRNGGRVIRRLPVPSGTNQLDWFGYVPQTLP